MSADSFAELPPAGARADWTIDQDWAAYTADEHRVWLTVTTGVLVAAAAGAKNVSTGAMLVVAWVVALVAIAKVQTTAAYANGAVAAEIVGVPRREGPRVFRQLDELGPVVSTFVAGAIVFFLLPTGLGGGDLARALVHHVQQGNFALADREQVGVDHGLVAEAHELTRVAGALQRAGEHEGELVAGEELARGARLVLALRQQRQVGDAGVAAVLAPLGGPVPDGEDVVEVAHGCPPGGSSGQPPWPRVSSLAALGPHEPCA